MPERPKLGALADLFGTSLDALGRPEAVVETKPSGTVHVVTAGQTVCVPAVSYTHLDVYKRQLILSGHVFQAHGYAAQICYLSVASKRQRALDIPFIT